jgi:hypothetical protein
LHPDPAAFCAAHPPDPNSPAQILYLETIFTFNNALVDGPRSFMSRLTLIEELQAQYRDFMRGHVRGWPRIGIHVRTISAHDITRDRSPLEWFESRIRTLREEYPDSFFFLSSDSADTSENLHRHFPSLLKEQLRPPGYNSKRGIQKGLVDLYILSQMDYIVGSYFSSFSEMARDLQGGKGYEDSQSRTGSLPGRSAIPR